MSGSNENLINRLNRMEGQWRKNQQEQGKTTPNAAETGNQQELFDIPLFDDSQDRATRAAPNVCLRSSLFGVVQRGRRVQYLEDTIMYALGSYEVLYKGERLDQADLDVWLQSLYISRHRCGNRVSFQEGNFLQAIARARGGRNRQWLRRSVDRMVDGTVTLRDGSRVYRGHLIQEMGRNDETGDFWLAINDKLARFFENDSYTLLDFKVRLSLSSDLEKWLHAFFSSHSAQGIPYKIETLHQLCGSECERYAFKRDLLNRLERLSNLGLVHWCLKNRDSVIVSVQPKVSQQPSSTNASPQPS